MGTFSDNNSLDLNTSVIDNADGSNATSQQGNTGDGNQGNQGGQGNQDIDSGQQGNQGNQGNQGGQQGQDGQQGNQGGQDGGSPSKGEETISLQEGDTVNIDGVAYTINNNGDAVAEDGTVFRTAAELKELIENNQANEEPTQLELLQEKYGNDYVDADGNPITFDNTPEGINSYIETVLAVQKREAQEAVIGNLFETYPIIEQLLDYIKINGSAEGFNEIPDRSKITVNKDNEEQQSAFIREEWKLSNKKGDVEKFIDYCKNAGILYDTAVESKEAVDAIYNEQLEAQEKHAAEIQKQAEDDLNAYWDNVASILDKKELMGYSIPDQIQCSRDGKNVMLTLDDFKRYISAPVDEAGNTQYSLDEAKVDANSRIQDDLLRAYLRFTGGNYSSLVGMEVNKQKVLSLKTTAAQANNRRTITINSKNNNSKPVDNNQLVLV